MNHYNTPQYPPFITNYYYTTTTTTTITIITQVSCRSSSSSGGGGGGGCARRSPAPVKGSVKSRAPYNSTVTTATRAHPQAHITTRTHTRTRNALFPTDYETR